jgi:hypothetical protein
VTDPEYDRYERGKDVLTTEQKTIVLYDARDKPLVREVGFRVKEAS